MVGTSNFIGGNMQKILLKYFFITVFMTSLFLTGCDKKNNEIVLQMEAENEASAEAEKSTEEKSELAADTGEQKTDESSETAKSETPVEQAPAASTSIMVHVCGAVLCEGVYELPSGSRVVDAVKAAGGFTADADSSYVNQASVLEDGSKLRIPTAEEVLSLNEGSLEGTDTALVASNDQYGVTGNSADSGEASSDSQGSSDKININTASEAELMTIPGIGPSKAGSIVSYRQENGKFSSIEDIMNVSGIKEKFFSKIKDYIRV